MLEFRRHAEGEFGPGCLDLSPIAELFLSIPRRFLSEDLSDDLTRSMVQALPETQNLPLRVEPHTPGRVIFETSFQSEQVEAALVVEIPASVLWT